MAPRVRFAALLLPPFLVGLWLRLYRSGEQILTGDELHVLKVALAWSPSEIVRSWTWYGADYGVPIALLYRALLDAGLVLTEMSLRAPMLACGALLIAVVPWCLRARIGGPPALLLAWLLALSPWLVLYSRLVRGYSPVALLATPTLLAFYGFWLSRDRASQLRCGAAYALAAALASWIHLPVAPLVLAPFPLAGLRVLVARGDDRATLLERLPALGALAALTALLLGLALLPARESLLALRGVHSGGGIPAVAAWLEIVRLHAGTTSPALALLVVAALLRGLLVLWRRDRDFAAYLVGLPLVLIAGLVLLGPDQLEKPIVMGRYLLALLPLGLALVALGLAEPAAQGRKARVAQATGVFVLLVAVLASGPLVSRAFRTSSFVHAATFLLFTQPGNRVEAADVPPPYGEAVASSESGTTHFVEFPWFNLASHAFDAYQHHHERPLVVASLSTEIADPRVALRNIVDAGPEGFLESSATHLAIHRNLRNEEARVQSNDPHHWRRLSQVDEIWRPLLRAGPAMDRRLRATWSEPDFADADVSIWDLERVRAGLSARRE